MHVDRARLDIDVVAPDRVQQLLARKDAAGMLEQEAQQAEFRRPERWIGRPSRVTRWAARSMATSAKLSCSSVLSGLARRMTARTRAISSDGLNGLVM
jgi:hypothetical protein